MCVGCVRVRGWLLQAEAKDLEEEGRGTGDSRGAKVEAHERDDDAKGGDDGEWEKSEK